MGENDQYQGPHKRPRMSKASGSGVPLDLFNPETHDFSIIRKKAGFVDYTTLIQLFFGGGDDFEPMKLCITAPSHFCKSSNMDEIRKFYGRLKVEGVLPDDITERPVYDIFRDTTIMKIDDVAVWNRVKINNPTILKNIADADPQTLLKNHFCAHPVMFVDFKASAIQDYLKAVAHCFKKIRLAYQENKDVLQKGVTDQGDKKVCQLWLNAGSWEDLSKSQSSALTEVKTGLETLCRCLFAAHGQKRVLILVDEYDAIVSGALSSNVPLEGMDAISKLMEAILGNITKGDIEKYLQGVLLTGISFVQGVGLSKMIKAKSCKFLDDVVGENPNQDDGFGKLLVQFYGVHENQVDELVQKLEKANMLKKRSDETKDDIKEKCNGYFTRKGKYVYSLWSVFHFLRDGVCSDTDNTMTRIGRIYRKAFECGTIGKDVLKLLSELSVSVKYCENPTLERLLRLRDNGVESEEDRNVLLSLLMDMGFLTNVKDKKPEHGESSDVKLPNGGIVAVFKRMFEEHSIQIGPFDLQKMLRCAEKFRLLASSMCDDDDLKSSLPSVHDALTNLFKGFGIYDLVELSESLLESLMWVTLVFKPEVFKVVPQYLTEDKKKVDLWVWVTLPDGGKVVLVIKLKFNKKGTKDCTSMYALKEVTGEQSRMVKGVEKFKNYRQELVNQCIEDYVMIGLSMSSTLEPSISVQTSKSDQKILISRIEPKLECYRTGYYEQCLDLFKDKIVVV